IRFNRYIPLTSQRNPVCFSLLVDFLTAKVFPRSVAAELAPMVSPSGLCQLRHPEIAPLSRDLGIPSLVKLLRLKSTCRCEKHRIPFKQRNYDIPASGLQNLALSQGKSGL
ncbi:MAG: hypothetical protein PHI59_04675, partial [Candidatus Omnitrophica bacterium]|nr:hypothetical protein [Candidatus Omnitrophota bacterium]